MSDADPPLSAQIVGAYGERIVEAELLRRGWIASNVNASVRNAADFDIFAFKNTAAVQIRVKSCGVKMDAFQFRFQSYGSERMTRSDFTALVSMGETRAADRLWVLPTTEVRTALSLHRDTYLTQAKRNGESRKDTGHWTLNLSGNTDRLNSGFAAKWSPYLDAWHLLES